MALQAALDAKYTIPTTLHELETALDQGRLYTRTSIASWAQVRRNGKTQRWKTRPDYFRVPFKVGLGTTGQIVPHNIEEFRISGEVV